MSATDAGVEHRVGRLDAIPVNEGRRVVLDDGREVAVFRLREGGVRATQAICPHRRGPLADGLVDGGRLVCPLHNRVFDLETGEATEGAAIATFSARVEEDGTVVVCLPDGEALPCALDDDAPSAEEVRTGPRDFPARPRGC